MRNLSSCKKEGSQKKNFNQQSFQKSEDTLMREEVHVVKADLKAANELLSNATAELHDVLSVTALNKQSVNVSTMMLGTAKTKQDQAMCDRVTISLF